MSPLVSRSLVSMLLRSAVSHWVYIVSTLVNCYLGKGKVSVESLWSLGGFLYISIQSILQNFPPYTQSVFLKKKREALLQSSLLRRWTQPQADHMAGGLIRAALDRYKQPKFPPVLQSAAPCVAYIYSLGCSVRARNSFSITATFIIENTSKW